MSAITIGSDEYIDYVPFADLPAGQVLVIGENVTYCEQPMKLGVKGALRVSGRVEMNADTPALTAGQAVYWDVANSRLTATPSTHKKAGFVEIDKPVNATRARIMLHPNM